VNFVVPGVVGVPAISAEPFRSKKSSLGGRPPAFQGLGKVPEWRFHGLVMRRSARAPAVLGRTMGLVERLGPAPLRSRPSRWSFGASNPPVLRRSPPALGRSDSTCSIGVRRPPRSGTSTLSSTWRAGSLRHRRPLMNDRRRRVRRRPNVRHDGAVASVISVCGPSRALATRCLRRPGARSHRFAQREARPPRLRKSRSASVGAMAAARW
jgi:hypothetical protein